MPTTIQNETRTLIRVSIFKEDALGWEVPENPDEFLSYWEEQFKRIPIEYRRSARLEIEAGDEYGSPTVYYTLTYVRPETDLEYDLRVKEQRRKREEQLKEDMVLLAQLRARYPEHFVDDSEAI